jgi:hypothetical protein
VDALEFEEDLVSVEASVAGLISVEEAKDMAGAGKTWDFGPSLMTQEMIDMLEEEGYIPTGKARPPQGEMVPKLGAADVVVFKDFFACGVHLPATRFFREVLEAFEVQLHHLTPTVFAP